MKARDAWRDRRVAEQYEARRFRGPLRRWKQRRDERLVVALLARAGGVRRVLDLPCGTGRLVPALARAGYLVLGADLALAMIAARGERARAAAGLGWMQADGERLPLRENGVDAVVSMRFLFHLRDPAVRLTLLREMARVARSAVVGQVRHRWSLKHALRFFRSRIGIRRRYRPSRDRAAIRSELGEAGLELLALVPLSRIFSDKALFLARPIR